MWMRLETMNRKQLTFRLAWTISIAFLTLALLMAGWAWKPKFEDSPQCYVLLTIAMIFAVLARSADNFLAAMDDEEERRGEKTEAA